MTSRRIAIILPWIAVGAVTLAYLLGVDGELDVNPDSAKYITLGRALDAGDGYRESWTPGTPPHTKYPPLFPLLLAGLSRVAGPSLIPLKLLVFACHLGGILLAFLLLRRYYGAWRSGAVTLVMAANPSLLSYSTLVMSEALYLLVSLAALLAYERFREQRSWSSVICCAALLTAATMTRGIGLVLVAAVGLSLWLDRSKGSERGKGLDQARRPVRLRGPARSALLIALPLAAVTIWGIRNLSLAGQLGEYSNEFFMIDNYRPDLGEVASGDLLQRMRENYRDHATNLAVTLLYPLKLLDHQGLTVALVLVWAVVLLTAGGLLHQVRRERRPGDYYTLLYLAVLLVWPWNDQRFLLPLAPWLILYCLSGVEGVSSLFKSATRRTIKSSGRLTGNVSIAAAVLFLVGLATTSTFAIHDLTQGRPEGRQLGAIKRAATWIAARTPANAAFLHARPAHLYLLSGRRARSYPLSRRPEAFSEALADPELTGVVVAPVGELDRGLDHAYLIPALQRERSRLLTRYAEREVAILEIVRE